MLLELLIEQQLVADAAQKAKLDETSDFAKRVRFLTRRAMRDQFMELQIVASVTEADARRLYQAQSAANKPEEELRVRHILLPTESEAAQLRTRLNANNFAALAQQFSKDPGNSWNGGDLGYITRGQMNEEFEAAAFKLKTGIISEPVRTQFGWHIILLEDRRVRETPSFDSIKDDIIRLLIQRKVQEVVLALRSSAKIEISDPDLSRAVLPSKTLAPTETEAPAASASSAPVPGITKPKQPSRAKIKFHQDLGAASAN